MLWESEGKEDGESSVGRERGTAILDGVFSGRPYREGDVGVKT